MRFVPAISPTSMVFLQACCVFLILPTCHWGFFHPVVSLDVTDVLLLLRNVNFPANSVHCVHTEWLAPEALIFLHYRNGAIDI